MLSAITSSLRATSYARTRAAGVPSLSKAEREMWLAPHIDVHMLQKLLLVPEVRQVTKVPEGAEASQGRVAYGQDLTVYFDFSAGH